MPNYKAPLRDMQFVYHELLASENIDQLPGMEDFSPDITDAVLEEASKICEELLFPLNRTGDEEGCHFDQGKVTVPKGFDEAYQQYKEAGWPSLMASPEFGGQGFPHTFYMLFGEMLCSSNLSFAMYPELTYGACNAISRFGSDEVKQKFMPKMVEGEWSGTMCLTEPHCGTDLAQIRTHAENAADDHYIITGSKIFISAGEHELTENIVHLVLARAPDAPEGIKGISLFLVPKFKINDDGSVGENNGVSCGSIEHKMGIKASSTCTMNFDGATGYLIGTLHKGMEAMFAMMNSARLGVGLQGVGLAEVAYQNAVEYANERLQGRALTGAKFPDKVADPIIVHPDIRRMLLTMRAYTEGARAMGGWIATYHDKDLKGSGQEKVNSEEMVALMTPVVKAFFTDIGVEVSNLGMQVFGGHGYIRENGMEQYARDARITQIYEGTNGIQALDLVGRKLPRRMGRLLRHFFHPVQGYIDQQLENPDLKRLATPLDKAFGRLQRATGYIAQQGMKNPDEAGAAANDYLRLFGLVSMGYIWLRMAEVSTQKLANSDDDFYQAKLDTATFYMERLLPQNSALFANIMAGSKTIMSFKAASF
jgi:butyryl-CoA dehydrogenase